MKTKVAWFRAAMAAIVLLRIVLWPFAQLAGTPRALLAPPWFLRWLPGMPPAAVIVAVQVVGVAGAVVAISRRKGAANGFVIAWLAFLFLAGLKTSTGKILHNDVTLLLAAVPLVLHRKDDDDATWPIEVAVVALAAIYFLCGYQKLVHSGLAWVTSDNMRWILYDAAASGRAPTAAVATAIADTPWAAHVTAAMLLGLELTFPVVVFVRKARLPYAIAAATLHTGTWLTLGLDYWSWSLVALVVLAMSSAILAKSTEMKMPSASARSSP
ncbi:MAG: hypothetical protein QOF60_841 [Actinomycetota bacterium]|jgi:hypothetical protein|nr:hypothetical protein [Actinomycetota bacterium]